MRDYNIQHINRAVTKPVFGVFDQGIHELGCRITDGLEISDLGSVGIVLSV